MGWKDSIIKRFAFRRKKRNQEVDWLRAEGSRQIKQPFVTRVLLPWVIASLALVIVGWSFNYFYFRNNPRFVLRNITVVSGNLNEMLVRESLGLREGMSIFDPSIELRRCYLANAPNIRSVSITRHLPSRITVHVVEREPIGRIQREGLVVDDEGVVFPHSAGVDHLPVLVGFEGIPVQSGGKLDGIGLSAVHFLSVVARPEYTLPVAMVDCSKQDYLYLTLSDHRQVKFWWKGMDSDTTDANEALRRRLQRLRQAMAMAPAHQMWDATVPDDTRIFSPN